MVKEIKRNTWSKFFKQFNSQNQYRHIRVSLEDKKNNDSELTWDSPFLGMALEKKGRLIDGVQLFSGWASPERVYYPVMHLKQPEKIVLDRDENGKDNRLMVETRDGTRATIELWGEKDASWHRDLVQKVAYSIYERRGCAHGNDGGDWLEAEKKVREAEEQFI